MGKRIARSLLVVATVVLSGALGACGDRIEVAAQAASAPMPAARPVSTGWPQPMATHDAEEPATRVMGSGAAPVAVAPPQDEDARLAVEVRQALDRDADLAGMKIDVSSEDGAVTLRGRAPDPDARTRATDLARTVRQVRSVENLLTLG